MLLFKCKCGCLFTTKDDAVPPDRQQRFHCQSCGAGLLYLPNNHALSEFKNDFAEAGMTVQKIPDNADITVTFKA